MVDEGWKVFLHPYGRTSSANVSSEGEKFFHRYEVALLISTYLGGHFKVNFIASRDYAYEVSRLITMEDKCLEYLFDILA